MKLTNYSTYNAQWENKELIIIWDKRNQTIVAIDLKEKSAGEFKKDEQEYITFMKAIIRHLVIENNKRATNYK